MKDSMVTVSFEDQIAIVSLNRPDKRNAMLPSMLTELNQVLIDCSAQTQAIALLGEGKTFCAGFDLKVCAQDPSGKIMSELLSGLSTVVRTMRSLEIPVVLGVHGAAVAGGCAMLGGADIVLADQSCKLGYPVVKIGVSPAVSAAFMMASIQAGPVRTRLLDTKLVSAEEAYQIGLVHELVDNAESVRSRTIQIASNLANKPGSAISATKAWLNEIVSPMTDNAQIGLDVSLSLTGSHEEQERLSSLWG
ncbi:MAG: enoyl-CoA hydratase/isomerase family protein [Phycisphaerales bacterium]|nr:enoyl-CoA hydratase/isomerase family protein [Phycisphaerales bacterium]